MASNDIIEEVQNCFDTHLDWVLDMVTRDRPPIITGMPYTKHWGKAVPVLKTLVRQEYGAMIHEEVERICNSEEFLNEIVERINAKQLK
jgi:hypothetical protein